MDWRGIYSVIEEVKAHEGEQPMAFLLSVDTRPSYGARWEVTLQIGRWRRIWFTTKRMRPLLARLFPRSAFAAEMSELRATAGVAFHSAFGEGGASDA